MHYFIWTNIIFSVLYLERTTCNSFEKCIYGVIIIRYSDSITQFENTLFHHFVNWNILLISNSHPKPDSGKALPNETPTSTTSATKYCIFYVNLFKICIAWCIVNFLVLFGWRRGLLYTVKGEIKPNNFILSEKK